MNGATKGSVTARRNTDLHTGAAYKNGVKSLNENHLTANVSPI